MKGIIINKIYEAVCEAIDNSFYHADRDKYNIGDKITKDCIKDGLPTDIAEIYSKKTGKDISHI